MQQLDLFEKDSSMYLWSELQKTKDNMDNVRRGIFARYNELEKLVWELKAQVDMKREQEKQL